MIQPTPDEQDAAARAAGLPVPEATEAELASQQPAVLSGAEATDDDQAQDDDPHGEE